MSQKKSSNTRWFGRVKSYEPGNGYGFIECAEAYEEFGRDVYLNGHELRKLDIKTIPVGAEIVFQLDVREGQPRATNLVLPSPKQCECMLFEYTEVLCKLSELLRLHDSTQVSYNALREAEDMLQCKECRRDESTEGAKVLLLLSEARQRWADKNHPCHEALREGLLKRLSKPPAQAVEMSIDRVRFTQQNHSKRFLHGPHEGQRIEWLTGQLLSGKIPFSDPSMVLNVVYYHGAYRSLNNRHLTAIVQYAHAVEAQNRVPKKCYVRVWPLLRGLLMDDGSDQDIIRKFLRANDSASDGTSIDCKRRIGPSTQVSQDVQIHVSNLDRTVQEPQLMEHLLKAGAEPLRVSIARRSSGRSKGESNCYGWVTFKDAECAEEFLQMPIPPLEGRELKLRLDNVSAIKQLSPGPEVSESGWVRCRGCYQACEPLLDVLLVEGVRLRRDNVPPGHFDQTPTFFCVGPEKSLNARVISPHPDSHGTSFKLAQVLCKTCGADLGNVQKGSEMQGGVVDLLGERVVHLKCASVLLELSDRQDMLLEVRKWQYLAQVTGRESIYKLSHLTMQEATEKLGLNLNSKVSDRNTNRHARVIPNRRLEAGSLEVKDADVTLAGYPPANE